MFSRPSAIRLLGAEDLDAFLALTGRDPVVNVFAEHRARLTSLEPRWLGGEVWGIDRDGRLAAACHAGANLVPIGGTVADAVTFATYAAQRVRSAATLVGRAEQALAMWDVLRPGWGPARDLRADQPHLELRGAPAVPPDPLVRPTSPQELETIYPACVAMYTEEVGVSPESGGGADFYRARVRQLIDKGWSFSRIEDGRVVFKAEVACVTPAAAQIQGVWVPPDLRGQGRAASGMAAVVAHVLRDIAPVVSLYVNDYNDAARRTYERVGFEQTATFATVLIV